MFLFRDLGSLLGDAPEDGIGAFYVRVCIGDPGRVANEPRFRLKGAYLLLQELTPAQLSTAILIPPSSPRFVTVSKVV